MSRLILMNFRMAVSGAIEKGVGVPANSEDTDPM